MRRRTAPSRPTYSRPTYSRPGHRNTQRTSGQEYSYVPDVSAFLGENKKTLLDILYGKNQRSIEAIYLDRDDLWK